MFNHLHRAGRPVYRAGWEDEVHGYIQAHRGAILGDVRQALEGPRATLVPRTRWAAWEAEVLAATAEPEAAQKAIVERQEAVDDDESERNLVAEYFAEQIKAAGYCPTGGRFLVPSAKAAEWLATALRRPFATNHASTFLKGLAIPELAPARSKAFRGWVWSGPDSDPEAEPRKGPLW
jgi:hypothetical protein